MKGTIRILLGMVMVMGGVGGMEANTTELLPLDSFAFAVAGLAVMAWGVAAANKNENNA